MIDSVSKAFFHALAGNAPLKSLASRYGMRNPSSFARRFIAGETIEEGIAAARAVEAAGLTQTLDYLGESVASIAAADQATRAYLAVIGAITAAGVGRNVSLKLTQLGLAVDRATSVDNLRRILDAAALHDFFVRVDMEDSAVTGVTLTSSSDVAAGLLNVGACLRRVLRARDARGEGLGIRVRR